MAVSVPKYCRHNASGRAYVKIQGKRHYLGRYGTPESKERYARFVAELAASPVAPAAVVPTGSAGGLTVVELADAYHEYCKTYYRRKDGTPSDWLNPIHLTLHTHLCGLYGRTPAAEFGPKKFKAIRQMLVDAGQSRVYVNKLMPIIRQCFKWGASEELVPSKVYHDLCTVGGLKKGRTAARETAPVLPVADMVVDATLPALPQVVADMIRFERLTGCRPGEACQVRPADIDRGAEVWEFRPGSHKTEHHGKQRTIYIGPHAQEILQPYLLRDATAYCFSPAESEAQRHEEMRARRKSKVQPSQRNRRKAKPRRPPANAYTKYSYRRAISRGIVKANRQIAETAEAAGVKAELIPDWHPNQLRHTRATQVRRSYGLEAAQIIMGHAKADVTQVYAERDSARAVEIMKEIG
jgi:integrase